MAQNGVHDVMVIAVHKMFCQINYMYTLQLVDDSINEATEQFEVELVSTSFGSRLGPVSKAAVLIDGPNDGE